jgi:hypothetical protein
VKILEQWRQGYSDVKGFDGEIISMATGGGGKVGWLLAAVGEDESDDCNVGVSKGFEG